MERERERKKDRKMESEGVRASGRAVERRGWDADSALLCLISPQWPSEAGCVVRSCVCCAWNCVLCVEVCVVRRSVCCAWKCVLCVEVCVVRGSVCCAWKCVLCVVVCVVCECERETGK